MVRRREAIVGGVLSILEAAASSRPAKYVTRGSGLVHYYYANSLKYYAKEFLRSTDEEILCLLSEGVWYFRLSWAMLQPERSRFNWALLDEGVERALRLGYRVAFRITTSENQPDQPFATPAWVFDAGARFARFDSGHPGTFSPIVGSNFEPDFSDPIFLGYLYDFLSSFRNRYKYLVPEFFDVGSFGVYGEGHTISSTKSLYCPDIIERHIRMHFEVLGDWPLVANHNFADSFGEARRRFQALDFARGLGMGLRDDSILIARGNRAHYDSKLAQQFRGIGPIVLETGEYSSLKKSGRWDESALMDAIRAYSPTHCGLYWSPFGLSSQESHLVSKISGRLGTKLVVECFDVKEDRNSLHVVIRNEGPSDVYSSIDIFCRRTEASQASGEVGQILLGNVSGLLAGAEVHLQAPIVDISSINVEDYYMVAVSRTYHCEVPLFSRCGTRSS